VSPGAVRRVALATRNPGKLAEFRRLLRKQPWELLDLDQAGFTGPLDEPGTTYLQNATAKAEAVCAATGLAALGDDSGIEIPALDGWPGPLSARWMGGAATDADRLRGLLTEVELRSPRHRQARYVCVVTLARPGLPRVSARGQTDGVLVEPRGSHGFGYDPAFLSDDLGITFGEASAAAKDRVSHRARALAWLLTRLPEGVAGPGPGVGGEGGRRER
jgi:XTP/dITP diphosphohydrolase